MRLTKRTSAVILLAVWLAHSLSCSGAGSGDQHVKIISWRCQRKEDLIVCDFKARKSPPGEFNSLLRTEFQDADGNVVNTCEKCNQTKGTGKPGSNEERKNVIVIFSLVPDDTLYNVFVAVQDMPEIKKYRFYFTDMTSNKVISNTVQGEVFKHM
jgi:hypothetical protein